ncbi:hypothetical protein BZG36_04924 [Bifiguratus adelaidae]|uniref:CigA protein n=1 Tax=Bifiguratus adelaidae TaxID=1938954 RepID=A0A261XWZ2_9FUNG|nr:hypothetical protein BZG36_04924 [Bifiguratus adelaidae]
MGRRRFWIVGLVLVVVLYIALPRRCYGDWLSFQRFRWTDGVMDEEDALSLDATNATSTTIGATQILSMDGMELEDVAPVVASTSTTSATAASTSPFTTTTEQIKPSPIVSTTPADLQPSTDSSATKYLTYLVHSGFHNQRIALINAFMVSYYTNRTLLVPPALIGEVFGWDGFDQMMYKQTHRYSKHELGDNCRNKTLISSDDDLKIRCQLADRYSWLQWDRLYNLTKLQGLVPFEWREDMDLHNLEKTYGFKEGDIRFVRDNSDPYEYAVPDPYSVKKPVAGKYRRILDMEELRNAPERLLHFGSLFGSGRVHAVSSHSRRVRSFIRQQFVFQGPSELLATAESLVERLGGPFTYVGLHARVGDGKFTRHAPEIMEKLWKSFTSKHEPVEGFEMTPFPPYKTGDDADYAPTYLTTPIDHLPAEMCLDPSQRPVPKNPKIPALVYLATDERHPDTHPLFQNLYRAFPCVITLGDLFGYNQSALATVTNPHDGANVGKFMIPFLDGLVASRGTHFTTSMWSTFSLYIKFLHDAFEYQGRAAADAKRFKWLTLDSILKEQRKEREAFARRQSLKKSTGKS